MIPVPSGVRVWLAVGRTDMRRGMNGLALQVQEALRRDPHAGDLYVFRGARGDLIKILWHDGLGMSLYAKRLEKGRFIWPSPTDGVVGISASQLGVHARWNRLAESASYVSSGACRIVADASIFDESSANICDSIWVWIRVVKPLQTTSKR
jgi:transposase